MIKNLQLLSVILVSIFLASCATTAPKTEPVNMNMEKECSHKNCTKEMHCDKKECNMKHCNKKHCNKKHHHAAKETVKVEKTEQKS